MRYAVFAMTAIVTFAIGTLAALTLQPTWRGDSELSQAAPNRPDNDREFDTWPSEEDSPSSVEGPAAEFRAELYGIVDPLVRKLPRSPQAHLLLASVHRRFAKREEAARELQQCLALDATFVEARRELGLMALSAGDYLGAEMHLRDAFQIAPSSDEVSVQLAQAQMSQGKFRDAVLTLETHLKLEPNHAEAWCRLGQAYQELGDPASAKRCYLTAIELNPDSVEAHYGMAKALQGLNEADEARKYFKEFQRMRQSSTATVRSDKAAWTDEGRVRTAIVKTLTEAGTIYATHGYLAEAEKCWTRATTLNPSCAECLEMLCRLRPNDPERWLKLGRLFIQDGRTEEAKDPFQRVIDLAPKRADGYAALAQAYIMLGENFQEAAELAQTAVQLESTAPNYFVLAAARERVVDWSGAEAALTHAIKLDPGEPRYREAHAKLQERHPK